MYIFSHLTKRTSLTTLLTASLTTIAVVGNAETAADKIARAITAAPADITDNATIMDVDLTMLREGANGWTCMPGIYLFPGDENPLCNDDTWMRWMAAAAAGEAFSTDVIGISYMLAGDALVNNANPMATDPGDGGVWVKDGAHLMILLPNMDMVSNLPRDPYVGGPYIMWADTPLVHVMMPIETKVAPE